MVKWLNNNGHGYGYVCRYVVHLNWRPKYPPNGLIRLYVIRVGVMTDNEENGGKKIVWRRR